MATIEKSIDLDVPPLIGATNRPTRSTRRTAPRQRHRRQMAPA